MTDHAHHIQDISACAPVATYQPYPAGLGLAGFYLLS